MVRPLHRPSSSFQHSSYDRALHNPPHQQLPVKPIRTTIDVLQAKAAKTSSSSISDARKDQKENPPPRWFIGAINLIYFIIARPKFPGTIYADIAELSSSRSDVLVGNRKIAEH